MLNDPIPVNFGKDANTELDLYVHEKLTYLKSQLKNLHETKVPQWRKWYRGIPAEKNKTFPWPNCSNLVVQLIGSHVDTLRSRILGSIFNTPPLYIGSLVGEWAEAEKGEDQREAFEEAMNYFGLEPSELDLYRVLSTCAGECIKFGSVFCKSPWETQIEYEVIGSNLGDARQYIKYDGPRPEKIVFEDFLADPTAPTLRAADFKVHRLRLNKFDILDRKQRGIYDKGAIDKIITKPDRMGRLRTESEALADAGIDPAGNNSEAEWDIFECHFSYWHNERKYNIIYTYHYESKTKLKAVFNFYPKEIEIFETARLGYDGEDGLFGYGFCEMLAPYQDEISTIHNQRTDSNTLANTSILRVSKTSKLDGIFSLYPMAVVPADQDEAEIMQLGRTASESVNYEQLTLSLAKDRAGIGPASGGMGSGITNPRKGNYTAMGTFAVMQEQNSRVAINTTDLRYFHVKLGRIFAMQYAKFGLGSKLQLFGSKAEYLRQALKNIESGRIALQIKASTASINRELEKQNDILLTNVLKQHYMGIAQILESVNNPQMPPDMKEYLFGVIKASHYLMHGILRNFSHEDTSRLLPLPKELKGVINGDTNNEGAGAGQNGRPATASAGNTVQPNPTAQGGAADSSIPTAGMESGGTIPTGGEVKPPVISNLQ